ncbi:putative retrotransposon hot spot (RHS) protein [Trypanosoma cruzi]|uniref:Putative retrotransposon hot spot (RHS) protein n=1 Tax=Trypanosoma cruzi TaxID=5693 RepID=A0A2V2UVA4_TRYCR|nr:putative retrotransposon hot spot (RHS) protein [Trypanosoma cruzi]
MTTASAHHTTTSTVRQFTECLAAYFNGWDELSRDMSWEIICVQHEDNKPMNGWRRCDVVNTENLSEDEKEIAAFWEEEVRQYIAAISSGEFRMGETLRSVEEPPKWANELGKGAILICGKEVLRDFYIFLDAFVCAYGAGAPAQDGSISHRFQNCPTLSNITVAEEIKEGNGLFGFW